MLARTTFVAAVLLAGLTTASSAQTYYPGYYGMGYYAPAGAFGSPWNYGSRPFVTFAPFGGMYAPYGAYGFAPRATFAPGPAYAYAPTGTFQATWQAPAATAAPAPRVVRAARTARASARAANAAQPAPMGPLPQSAYQPTGTFQALWEAPPTPAPRGSRVLP